MPASVKRNRPYSVFYWPLALTSVAMQLESQFQNAVLARFPDGDVELATFALASSSFQLLNAFLIFVPQTVTVLATSPRARAACLRHVVLISLGLSFPMALLAYTPVGSGALTLLLRIPHAMLPSVVQYLRWLTPLLLVNALRQHYTGVLIQSERTRAVTVLNFVHLGSLLLVLLLGRIRGWGALGTLASATITSNLLHLALIAALTGRSGGQNRERPGRPDPSKPLTFRKFFEFFWPVAFTSGMFALSRPVTYAFINRTSSAVATVAALRLAFDFAMFFQNQVNQFRHLYATYGATDPEGVRRYTLRATVGLTAAMAAIAFSPLSRIVFGQWMGVEGQVLEQAVGALRVMCLGPLVIAFRNLHHGDMMIRRRTRGMAAGAALRVLAILGGSWALFHLGLLNHLGAAFLMVLGFFVEALVSRHAVRRKAGR